MAAQANTIKKYMHLKREDDGTIIETIQLIRRPDGKAYVHGKEDYPCGDFTTDPITTMQRVMETVAAFTTEWAKAVERPLTPLSDPDSAQFEVVPEV